MHLGNRPYRRPRVRWASTAGWIRYYAEKLSAPLSVGGLSAPQTNASA